MGASWGLHVGLGKEEGIGLGWVVWFGWLRRGLRNKKYCGEGTNKGMNSVLRKSNL